MKLFTAARLAIAMSVVLLGLAPVPGAHADVAVHIDIGNAPPPPRVVFRSEPHVIYVPEERVYVVDDPYAGDDDYFRYGPYWYAFNDGYWYRARTWRGPFVVVRPRYVPAAIYHVPPGRWKHHARWKEEWREERGERGQHGEHGEHGHGHGHGKHGGDND